MVIESKNNQLYKNLIKLLNKKYRDSKGLYILEGIKIYNDYLDKIDVEYIILNENIKLKRNRKYTYYELKSNLFNNISTHKNSQGIIIIARKPKNSILSIENNDIVVMDNIQDPGNLGTIIRTLVAFNFKYLILTDDSVDEYSPKVVRSSMGSIVNINILRMEKSKIIESLTSLCYNVLVTNLSNDSVSYKEIKLKEKNAYIFGNEGKGVSDIFLSSFTKHIKIPINSNVESLNVAISASIILSEMKFKKGD